MFNNDNLKHKFKSFLKIYNSRPIKDNTSGMRIDHCFAVYCLLKKIKPTNVIESGVWRGQTTWLIRNTLKKANIFSIDIDLSNRKIIYDDVIYYNKDISKINWHKLNKSKTLVIFDDHVCFSKRIGFLIKNNFKHIIFDDNLPNGFSPYYSPKIIYEKKYLIKKRFIKYSNLKRLIKFLTNFYILGNKKNFNIRFNKSFLKVVYPPKINPKLNKLFNKFIYKTELYFEFPPLIKFNLKKRFKKLINVFGENVNKEDYKVKKPISNLKELKVNKSLHSEFNQQYASICYVKLK
ncbi:hypothetical protein [Candidatus Pelagibacter communis]|uniref:hypothetical protein n=1 Tax=Pelagibacter ubique TaxID=198252 RepID=UPI00094D680C|nr:hypothetical protein [Candidatus Pelagibacter ubique]